MHGQKRASVKCADLRNAVGVAGCFFVCALGGAVTPMVM